LFINKVKNILKITTIIFVTTIILFGVYRREYIVQAVPVYLQYLEQKIKWQKNSGMYLYFFSDRCADDYIFFVDHNQLSKALPIGAAYLVENLKSQQKITYYAENRCYPEDRYKNYFLIDKRFDEILGVLLEKLWDIDDNYIYKIGYDKQYGYPIGIMVDKKKKVIRGVIGGIGYPSFDFFIYDFKMLPKDTIYSNEVLTKLLQWAKERDLHRRQKPTQENNNSKNESIVEEVGGDLIKGMVIKRY